MTGALRTLAFGEPQPDGVWGAAWIPRDADGDAHGDGDGDSGGAAVAALGAAGESSVVSGVRVTGGEEWRLDADAAGLVVSPMGEAVAVQGTDDDIAGWDQVCRVSGRFTHDGTEHAVDCLGLQSWWSDAIDVGRYESIRSVSVWFEPDEALTLTAFRPRKAKAHDRDVLAAAVIAADLSASVDDPRLSTTYEAAGWPARAGLELWLTGDEPERQYPRRASGEATGPRAEALAGALELRAEPFRWHSRGREAAGMYLLARAR